MAAAFFNVLADPRRAHALSAGTEPGATVHPEVVTVMRESGIDLEHARPTRLTDELARQCNVLITMGCGETCPLVPGLERIEWNVPDPKGQPLLQVRAIRDEIRARVEALVADRKWEHRAAAKPYVLFLCTHNAARSQMAEVLLRKHAGARFEAGSAGFQPTEVHPLTQKVLQEIGEDVHALRAKGLNEFLGRTQVRYAIIVCEEDEASCPRVYPFALRSERWPFPDPLRLEGAPEMQLQAFRDVRDAIDRKVRAWVQEVQ